MDQYRKKPLVIEAEQWFSTSREPHMTIKTLEGEMVVGDGDWIIRGIEGELYPCKDSIFKATYEKI